MRSHSFRQALVGLVLVATLGFVGYTAAQAPAPPAPSPQVPAAGPAPPAPPAPPVERAFRTGARSSRRHWLAYEATKDPRFSHRAKAAPASFTPAVILTPAQMSYWGNDQYGDCVSAEEAFAKDIYPVWHSNTGKPILIPTATVTAWARQHGWLNGADLTSPMDAMASEGMVVNGTTYTDGPYQSVDYTNWTALTSAIYQGPVKIGCAARQLQNTAGVGERNGWVATGYRRDGNEDHCTSLCGYGTMQFLASAMGVTLPSNVNGSSNGVLFYTWDTIGIMDFQSMVNITGEAWLRQPTTPQTPPPDPTPNPTPTPTGLTYTLVNAPAGAAIDSTGVFSWPIPATQAPGTVTITFTASGAGGSATGSFTINVAAAGAIVISPIPAQSGSAGSTFSLNLDQFVSQGEVPHGPGH